MTTVTFLTEGSRIVGFEVSGHSGYADAGEDIRRYQCRAAGGGHRE